MPFGCSFWTHRPAEPLSQRRHLLLEFTASGHSRNAEPCGRLDTQISHHTRRHSCRFGRFNLLLLVAVQPRSTINSLTEIQLNLLRKEPSRETPARQTKLKPKMRMVAGSGTEVISEILGCTEAYWSVHESATRWCQKDHHARFSSATNQTGTLFRASVRTSRVTCHISKPTAGGGRARRPLPARFYQNASREDISWN